MHKGEVSQAAWLLECPPAARPALAALVSGESTPAMALLQLLMALPSGAEAQQVVDRAARLSRAGGGPVMSTLDPLRALLREHPEAWQIVAQTLEQVDGGWDADVEVPTEPGASGTDSVAARRLARLAARFDRAAAQHPEASVALYSLGEPALLGAATAELVQRLRDWELLDRDWQYLDIGCGIGRIEHALAPDVGFITGIDISPQMLEHARTRCSAAINVAFRLTSGGALDGFADGCMDVLLAVDSFPYLERCGGARLVERLLSEAARVLKPGGQLAIFNFSYRGDLDADRSELARLAPRVGLTIVRNGVQGLRTWDGAGFQLRK
jgi:SAM-dependent methyltransferase